MQMIQTPVRQISTDKTVSAVKARFMMICVAIGYSTMGAALKYVDWNPLVITGARNMVAFVFLAISRGSIRIPLRRDVVVGAVLSYFTSTCFVFANKLTTAANAIVLQYTNPIFVLIFAAIFLKKPLRKRDVVLSVLMILGIALFFLDDLSAGQTAGNLFGLLSGIGMAGSILYACYSGTDLREYTMLMCLIAAAVGLPSAIAAPPNLSISSITAVLFLGIVGMGISSILYAKAAPNLPSVEVSMLLMLDPILNPVWVALCVGELPGKFALVGGLVVLACMAANTWFSCRESRISKSALENDS